MGSQVDSARVIAKCITIPVGSGLSADFAEKLSRGGIFIGEIVPFGVPFFLNFDMLVNTHVFVCGMTGSGKTYLAKNLMLKLARLAGHTVVVIDFTGEYGEFAREAGMRKFSKRVLSDSLRIGNTGIIYADLSGNAERRKVSEGIAALDCIVSEMKKGGRDPKSKIFVVLDEAWKAIRGGDTLEMIIREGRKYGVGVILVSQLIEDVEPKFLSNMATVAIFKMVNEQSLEILSKNYGFEPGQIEDVQSLGIGSCYVINVMRSGERMPFRIKAVKGLRPWIGLLISTNKGGSMEVGMEEFCSAVEDLCGKKEGTAILLSKVRQNRIVRIDLLVKELLCLGADRRKALAMLREVGVGDADIADAFAYAIKEIERHEK